MNFALKAMRGGEETREGMSSRNPSPNGLGEGYLKKQFLLAVPLTQPPFLDVHPLPLGEGFLN